jgi:DNA-binding response OmpR family regulator
MTQVLIVDDNPLVLASISIILGDAGYAVTPARDTRLGLEKIMNTDFAVVITDIWLGGSSGVDLIREGRRCAPKTRFLAITGRGPNGPGPQAASQPPNFGADALLLKPFEKRDLVDAVARLANSWKGRPSPA